MKGTENDGVYTVSTSVMKDDMEINRLARTIETTSVLLFFIQALRVIFSVLFGIIYDQIFEGPIDAWLIGSNLLVVVALVMPALATRRKPGRWLCVMVILSTLGRLALTVNDASVRYWGSLVVLAFGGLYMAVLLWTARSVFITGLLNALILDQLLRLAGQTYDVSLRQGWLPIQILWSALLIGVSIWLYLRTVEKEVDSDGMMWKEGLALSGFLFLETSLLTLPNAVVRWSHTPYAVIAPLFMGITIIPALPGMQSRLYRASKSIMMRVSLVILCILCLILGYFTEGAISGAVLALAQLSALMMIIRIFGGVPGNSRSTGSRVAIGLLLFLILNFFNAFAFTYPYTLAFMRDLGWVVFLVAVFLLGLAFVLRPSRGEDLHAPVIRPVPGLILATFVILLAVGFALPKPSRPFSESGRLRIGTYNIHYGYDDEWHFSLEEIAAAIEADEVDVVALQEVDTGRMTSYGVDDAIFLSRRLGMNAVYLPTVEHLTGIALLYRGPTAQTDATLLTSLQEQTGIVHVLLDIEGQPLKIYGIWVGLGDEDKLQQIEEAIRFMGKGSPAALGGDFNSQPGSPVVEEVIEAEFEDPFIMLGIDPPPPTSPAVDPISRIDYVWVRGLKPTQAWVSESMASDHRLVVVEVILD